MPAAALDFELSADRARGVPPEVAGKGRDDVRLMVGWRADGRVTEDRFPSLGRHLQAGDLLVVNTSATLPAALDAVTAEGEEVRLHLSTPLPGGLWVVEPRLPLGPGSRPRATERSEGLVLPGGGRAELLRPHPATSRLWLAAVAVPGSIEAYLARHGQPIRYEYAEAAWPLAMYQTVYARQPGSAEMPSAGRPFTAKLLTELVSRGIAVMPVVLHSGVASLEEGETPAEERFLVPEATAAVANSLRAAGGRLVAVGTTVVRALETVADFRGQLHPGGGLTDLVISAVRPPRAVDGLLTGWHEPRASHLALVESIAGEELLETMYHRAVDHGYAWHEFGDSCLILP
jgi:S-adenosylmethionine:tRNA ribosyltransferase-isomerase